MNETTPLNVAVIGSGFMGRAHSNAWLAVRQPYFFMARKHKPVLSACCGRPEGKEKLESFLPELGLRVHGVRLGAS